MASTKGKLKTGLNQVVEDSGDSRRGAAKGLKIYTEHKVKADLVSKRTSLARCKGAPSSASDTKGSLKNKVNNTGKLDTSSNMNVQRKALADVSNVKGTVSRSIVHDGLKLTKSERNSFSKRASVVSGARTVNDVSRKSFREKGRTSLDLHSLKRDAIKDMKAPLDDQRIKYKNSSNDSVISNSRTIRNSNVLMRKSLPVLKRINQADTNCFKENVGRLENAEETSKATMKDKVSKNVTAGVGNTKNYIGRNRASDGFTLEASKVQTNAAANRLSGRSIRPLVKTTLRATNARRTSKSDGSSSMKKSGAAIPSKKKEEAVSSSHLDKVVPVVLNVASQNDPSNDGNTTNTSDMISRRRSNRRRSYTSLLLAKSKLLEEHGDVMDEKLPRIDSEGNQLEVAQYVDEIYQYYWNSETYNMPTADYMRIQKELTPHMRGILINWLIEVHFKFDLMQETLYLMVTLLDRYLSQVEVKKNEMQLVGLTVLLLASKYEDFWHPRVKDLISISAEAYTRDQMLGMEKAILKELKFRLNTPTPYVFMLRFLKAAQSDTKLEHLAFYLIELCLVEYEALKFKASLLCASAIYVARCTLQMAPAWTPLLCKHARYDVPEIRDCAEMILKFQRAAKSGQLKVTYEKYMSPDLSCVAAIKPLDKLP